jgi:hypothetical protein
MLCDIEVQDTPTVVTDDEKAIERAEGDRRNSEEVHRGNRFTVITEKGKPVPGRLRISRRPFHPTRDRSLRDIKAEHEKLAMHVWRSPRGVLNDKTGKFLTTGVLCECEHRISLASEIRAGGPRIRQFKNHHPN